MSESSQGPAIRLDIDQEIYVDSVLVDDTIVDATVATEVTSLDKVGDAYVLEGAIVFSGLLERPSSAADSFEIESSRHRDGPHNIQHRLPFLLRVPSRSQPRGIVNVASRISSWNLNVVSENWVHMEADLQISGLNGHEGFHFQCGPQEFGNLSFQVETQANPLEHDHGKDGLAQANQASVQEPPQDGAPVYQQDEVLSESPKAPQFEDVTAAMMSMGVPAQRELADFDRVFEGEPSLAHESMEMRGFDAVGSDGQSLRDDSPDDREESAAVHAVLRTEETSNADFAEANDSATQEERVDATEVRVENRKDEPQYPEFDFAHQISPDLIQESKTTPEAPGDVPFSAARSFSDTGFSPHTGFKADSPASSKDLGFDDRSMSPASEGKRNEASLDDSETTSEDVRAQDMEPSSDSLWAFVDFNQPERSYTLRYVIVMEEETLQSVADRVGCTKIDLMSVNGLTADEVFVGQSLRIPVQGVVVPKLSS